MPFSYVIHSMPSDKWREDRNAPDTFYWFEDGLVTAADTALVWCSDCQDVTRGEVFESLEELDVLIDEYSKKLQQSKLLESSMKGLLSTAIHRRRWRQMRVSAPKCLQCGKTAIQVLPIDEEVELEGNTITIHWGDHWEGEWERRYLNTEGEWLEPDPTGKENERQAKHWWQFWR